MFKLKTSLTIVCITCSALLAGCPVTADNSFKACEAVQLQQPVSISTFSGTCGSVNFQAENLGSEKAKIIYSIPDGVAGSVQLEAELINATRGLLRWNGLEFDGIGELTNTERRALEEISNSPLSHALAKIPLDLSCQLNIDPQSADDLAPIAALLFPWQMQLKYIYENSTAIAQEKAASSTCSYFRGTSHSVDADKNYLQPRLILLSKDNPLPSVFLYAPLDDEGGFPFQ